MPAASTSTRARRWATCRSARALSVTPMQMAAAYAAIANGGVLRAPHVVRRVDGKLAPAARASASSRRDDRAAAAHDARGRLRAGRHRERGRRSPATSWRARPARRTRSTRPPASTRSSRYVASFVGFAPALNPKLLIGVMVDEPQGAIYGGAGRGAGVRADRRLRAAVPADPAADIGSRRRDDCWQSVIGESATGAPAVEITALAYDNRARDPGHAVLLRPGLHARRPRLRADAIARGAVALVVERPLGLGVPEVLVDDVRAAMAPAAARAVRRSDGAAAHRRHHRHERQDDDGVPRPRRCSRPAGARPACWAR